LISRRLGVTGLPVPSESCLPISTHHSGDRRGLHHHDEARNVGAVLSLSARHLWRYFHFWPLVQNLWCGRTVGSPWSSASSPLGRGRAAPPPPLLDVAHLLLDCPASESPARHLWHTLLRPFLTFGPDLWMCPFCWFSVEFLRDPIPQKGTGSSTTTCCFAKFRII